jgi:hypothetical protein
MRTSLVASILLAILVAVSAEGGVEPADSCKDAKAKAVGKKTADVLTAYGKNLKKFDPAKLAAGVSKAQSKLTKAFVKAEGKGGCATTGDTAVLESKVDAMSFAIMEDVVGSTCGNGVVGGSEECDAGPPNGAGFVGYCLCVAGCECDGCGDGIVYPGLECDEGAANGTPDSCCNIDCTLTPASTACTDTDGNICTIAGCDGASGACDQGHILTPTSTPCPDTDGNPGTTAGCDGAGTCDQLHLSPSGAFLSMTDGLFD